jgi:hypothetical protein
MDLQSSIYIIFSSIASQIPTLIVYFIGIGLGLYNYRKSKMPSIFAIIGCSILLLDSLISPFRVLLNQYLFSGNVTADTIAYINLGVNLAFSILFSIGLGFILLAVWKDRQAK